MSAHALLRMSACVRTCFIEVMRQHVVHGFFVEWHAVSLARASMHDSHHSAPPGLLSTALICDAFLEPQTAPPEVADLALVKCILPVVGGTPLAQALPVHVAAAAAA